MTVHAILHGNSPFWIHPVFSKQLQRISTVSHSFLSSSGFGAIGYLKDNAHIMVLGFQA